MAEAGLSPPTTHTTKNTRLTPARLPTTLGSTHLAPAHLPASLPSPPLPRRCRSPQDYLFDPANYDDAPEAWGPPLAIREASFLENERTPAQVKVGVQGAGWVCGVWGVWGQGRGSWQVEAWGCSPERWLGALLPRSLEAALACFLAWRPCIFPCLPLTCSSLPHTTTLPPHHAPPPQPPRPASCRAHAQDSVLIIQPSAALDCSDCVKEGAGQGGARVLLVPPALPDAQLLPLLEKYRSYRVWRLNFAGVGATKRAYGGFGDAAAAAAFDRRVDHMTTEFCCRCVCLCLCAGVPALGGVFCFVVCFGMCLGGRRGSSD